MGKTLKNSAVPALFLLFCLSTYCKQEKVEHQELKQCGEEYKGLVGMGQVNLIDFVRGLAYPHLNKKDEDMDGSHAIHLIFSWVAFFPFSAFHGA